MRKKRIILAAVGERGVTYGVSHGEGTLMPDQFLELLITSGADSYDLTRGGAIAYFLESRRTSKLLENFFTLAEALRGSRPKVGVGVAHETLVGQFDWLGRLKRNFQVDALTEKRALDNIQGVQTYRSILDEIA